MFRSRVGKSNQQINQLKSEGTDWRGPILVSFGKGLSAVEGIKNKLCFFGPFSLSGRRVVLSLNSDHLSQFEEIKLELIGGKNFLSSEENFQLESKLAIELSRDLEPDPAGFPFREGKGRAFLKNINLTLCVAPFTCARTHKHT